MQQANLHLAFCSIYDCKTCCLAAESLSRERMRVYKQFARVKDVQRASHYKYMRSEEFLREVHPPPSVIVEDHLE